MLQWRKARFFKNQAQNAGDFNQIRLEKTRMIVCV
jgi:hypothetical protein